MLTAKTWNENTSMTLKTNWQLNNVNDNRQTRQLFNDSTFLTMIVLGQLLFLLRHLILHHWCFREPSSPLLSVSPWKKARTASESTRMIYKIKTKDKWQKNNNKPNTHKTPILKKLSCKINVKCTCENVWCSTYYCTLFLSLVKQIMNAPVFFDIHMCSGVILIEMLYLSLK